MMNLKQTTTVSSTALLLLGLCPVLASASQFLRNNRQAPTICGFETKYSSTFVILEVDYDAKSNNGNNGNGNNKNVLSITDANDVNASFVDSYKSKCTASGLDQSILNGTLVEDAIYDKTLDQLVEREALDDPELTPIVEAATERQGELTPTGDFRVLVEVVQACNACDETPNLFSESKQDQSKFDLGDQVPFRLSFLSGLAGGDSSSPFRQFVGALTGSGDSSSSSASTTESKKVCSCSGPTEDDFTKAISKEFDDITVTAVTQVSVLSNGLCNGFDETLIPRQAVGPTKYSYSGVCLGTDYEVFVAPTNPPSSAPTTGPTSTPTATPTSSPTNVPTDTPTDNPTDEPTEEPVQAPVSPPEPVDPCAGRAACSTVGSAQSRTVALTGAAESELP